MSSSSVPTGYFLIFNPVNAMPLGSPLQVAVSWYFPTQEDMFALIAKQEPTLASKTIEYAQALNLSVDGTPCPFIAKWNPWMSYQVTDIQKNMDSIHPISQESIQDSISRCALYSPSGCTFPRLYSN